MPKSAYHILRVGLAITFLWIGVLILKDPEGWGSYILPWAFNLLPLPLEFVMINAAILDIVIGILLLVDAWVWLVGTVAVLHLVVILAVSGINSITIRDVGILTASLSLAVSSWQSYKRKF